MSQFLSCAALSMSLPSREFSPYRFLKIRAFSYYRCYDAFGCILIISSDRHQ